MIRLYGRTPRANRLPSAEPAVLGGVALAGLGVVLTWLLFTF